MKDANGTVIAGGLLLWSTLQTCDHALPGNARQAGQAATGQLLLAQQAVKELKAENDALKVQQAALTARLAALEQMVQQLKAATSQPKRP